MIDVQGLCKNFGPVEAVKDVSFTAAGFEILGLLGPNGAGKTTILRVLAGCHEPSSGQVTIDGLNADEQSREIKQRIGYLPENNPLYGDMTPAEYLSFIAEVQLIPKDKKKIAVENAIVSCGLESCMNKRIDTLSKGYRQRTGLAAAIVNDPPILILDEPTSGLDPNQIIEMRSLIRELGKRKTVMFSTHILQEAEALCSRLLIINEGRIQFDGSPPDINEMSLEDLFVRLTGKPALPDAASGEKQ